MAFATDKALALAATLALAGCFGPDDRRPGMWLPGELEPTPADWSFTNDHPEIAIEVGTPYFLRHSVTIVCAALDGTLYVGARNPETKNWPAWADAEPDVRLGIADRVYEARLTPIDEDLALVARVRAAYGAKYGRPPPANPEAAPFVRYWRVGPRT